MNRPQKYYNFTYDTLRRWVKVRPGALALLCVDLEAGTEVRLTFAELYRKISQTANFLVSKMIEKGDRVSVDFDTGVITDITTGKVFQAQAFPPFIQNIIEKGGLLASLRAEKDGD